MMHNPIRLLGFAHGLSRGAALVVAFCLLLSTSLPDRLIAQDLPERDAHDTHALTRWIGLPHDRQLLVLQSLGVSVPQDFFNCVCRAAGYGSPGTNQFYHPDTLGTYDERYSCQHPGPPCIVAGFGCTRHELPSDPKIFEGCAAMAELEGGNPFDNILSALRDRGNRVALSGNPVTMNATPAADPPPDCTKTRADAGFTPPLPALADIPKQNMLFNLSPEALARLNNVGLQPDVEKRLLGALQEIAARIHDVAVSGADEADLRIDFDVSTEIGIEVGFSVNDDRQIHVSEIVLKPRAAAYKSSVAEVGPEFAFTMAKADPDDSTAALGHTWEGFKFGFSAEGKAGPLKGKEVKYGIDLKFANKATDYYDGEWQTESEYALVRGVEDLVSKLDFYAGGAFGTDAPLPPMLDGKMNVGPEFTWKLKDRYSNWLFSDMNAALDNLLDNQATWEAQRRDYIAREAKRFGIDARCFTTGQTISLTHDAYARQQAADPTVAAPFQTITERIAARKARPVVPDQPSKQPAPIPPVAPAPTTEGIYKQPMLR